MGRYRVIKKDGGYFVANRRTGKLYGWYPRSREKARAQAAAMEAWFSSRPRPGNAWTRYLCRRCGVKVAAHAQAERKAARFAARA